MGTRSTAHASHLWNPLSLTFATTARLCVTARNGDLLSEQVMNPVTGLCINLGGHERCYFRYIHVIAFVILRGRRRHPRLELGTFEVEVGE